MSDQYNLPDSYNQDEEIKKAFENVFKVRHMGKMIGMYVFDDGLNDILRQKLLDDYQVELIEFREEEKEKISHSPILLSGCGSSGRTSLAYLIAEASIRSDILVDDINHGKGSIVIAGESYSKLNKDMLAHFDELSRGVQEFKDFDGAVMMKPDEPEILKSKYMIDKDRVSVPRHFKNNNKKFGTYGAPKKNMNVRKSGRGR